MTVPDGSTPNEQAAVWLGRLRNRTVTAADLDDFARWRRDPLNAAAYRRAVASGRKGRGGSEDQGVFPGSADAAGWRWDRIGSMTLALIGVLAVAFLAFDIGRVRPTPTLPVYRTEVGERSTATLDDGSRMQLDADSEASVRFDATRRGILLSRGQAFFTVRHDAARPFVVEAGNGLTVTAIGTRFDVLRIDGRVRVSLVDGSVAIKRSGALMVTLKPGEIVVVGGAGAVLPLRRSLEDVLAWRKGHLSFRDTPLEQAVAEMNRYTRRPFAVGAVTDARARVSGEFSTDDPEGFASAVEALLGEGAIKRVPL